jgi:hypothetical protein
MIEPIYTKGETVALHCDIFPAFIHPLPEGVPANIVRKRVIVTERCLTVGWAVGGRVSRVDIPLTAEETANMTLRGGTAGPYEIGLNKGCGSCGAGLIKGYKFWPGVVTKSLPRTELAAAEIKKDPGRYTRTRS